MKIKLYKSTNPQDYAGGKLFLARIPIPNIGNNDNNNINQNPSNTEIEYALFEQDKIQKIISLIIVSAKNFNIPVETLGDLNIVQVPMDKKQYYENRQTYIHTKRGSITGYSSNTSRILELTQRLAEYYADELIDYYMNRLPCHNVNIISHGDLLKNDNCLENLEIEISVMNSASPDFGSILN